MSNFVDRRHEGFSSLSFELGTYTYSVLLFAQISTTLQFITKQAISFRPHKTDYARVFPTG